ncbi:hypothetical protein FRB99_006876 [Tulasnella sp. 403]|nr:hypothetical protein FRB99_006876 [Tulasnella sp. 403]
MLHGAESHESKTISAAAEIASVAFKWALEKKRRWNRATPIYRLPTEVLLEIFRHCAPTDELEPPGGIVPYMQGWFSVHKYYQDLLKLSGVSFDWARTIHDTPSFWVYSSSEIPRSLVDLTLERSQTLPLRVVYCAEEMNHQRSIKAHDYLEAIGKELHRCRMLYLRIADRDYDCGSDLRRLCAGTFPQLSQLFLVGDGYWDLPLPFRVVQPPLRYLHVDNVPLTWADWQLSGLEVLRLVDLTPADQREIISFSQLLGIIDASPSLKTLEIRSTFISGVPENQPPAIMSSSTRALDHLKLVDIKPGRATPLLLSHVLMHGNSNVSVRISDHAWNSQADVEGVLQMFGLLSQQLSSSTPSTILTILDINTLLGVSLQGDRRFKFKHGDGVCNVEITDNTEATIRQAVMSLNPDHRGRPTTLRLSMRSPMNGLIPFLNNHLNVVHLTVRQMNKFPVQDLYSLSPTTKWLFPNLTQLDLHVTGILSTSDAAQTPPAKLAPWFKAVEVRSGLAQTGTKEGAGLKRVGLQGYGRLRRQVIKQLEALVPEVEVGRNLQIVDD